MPFHAKNTKKEQCKSICRVSRERCEDKELLPELGYCRSHSVNRTRSIHKTLRKAGWNLVMSVEAHHPESQQVVFPGNPFDSLMQVVTETHDFKELLARKIEAMGEDGEDWRYQDKTGSEQLRSEIALYERALDRTVRCATALSKLNIEERYLKLSERQASMIIYVLRETLKRMDLKERQDEASAIVSRVISEIMETGHKSWDMV